MAEGNTEPVLRCYKDVKPEKLEWLWPNRIPLGKMTLLVGHPGVGKSFLSLYMAAQVSSGRAWVDTFGGEKPGSVIVLTAEDDPGDTVSVRLIASKADMAKVYEIQGIRTEGGMRGLYNLTKDMPVLIRAIQEIGDVRLVVIDPISAYMEGKNENKNAEVREYLNPLIQIASIGNLAIVGITHMNKNADLTPGQRVLGSTGFLAAARAAWLVQLDKNNSERRLFVPLKGNLSENPNGLAYRLMSRSVQTEKGLAPSAYCAFESDPVYFTAEELLAPDKGSPGRPGKRETAGDWLWNYLSDGPKLWTDIKQAGEKAEYKEKTLKRAKKDNNIQSICSYNPETGKNDWEWALPTD